MSGAFISNFGRPASALNAIAIVLSLFLWGATGARAQSSVARSGGSPINDKATVIVAVDLREMTSIRDVDHVGDVFFRRVDERYASRTNGDYDFGIQGSVGADWRAKFGGQDQNRAPHMFEIRPGTYVIEKINIGGGPTTVGPGYDLTSHRPRFGSFTVRSGEVVNLGKLVVHMHWHEGYFDAQVSDDAADVARYVDDKIPTLKSRVQTRALTVVQKFAFQPNGGRL